MTGAISMLNLSIRVDGIADDRGESVFFGEIPLDVVGNSYPWVVRVCALKSRKFIFLEDLRVTFSAFLELRFLLVYLHERKFNPDLSLLCGV